MLNYTICLSQQAAAIHKIFATLIHKLSGVQWGSLTSAWTRLESYIFQLITLTTSFSFLSAPSPTPSHLTRHCCIFQNQAVTRCNMAQFVLKSSILNTKEELVGQVKKKRLKTS